VGALERYLQDHHAGGSAGVRLARSLAGSLPSASAGALADVAREIGEDLRALERVMAARGVHPSTARDVSARIGGLGARARRALARSTARRAAALLIELELLEMGITGKRLLWVALLSLGEGNDAELEALVGRAERQQAAVEAVRLAVAQTALRA
jgi:hypothetical protein